MLVLLADSRPLFEPSLIERIHQALQSRTSPEQAKAAYLGASNGDVPRFYEIFEAAMDKLAIGSRMHVTAEPTPEAIAFLRDADLLLLAGGDVEPGWRSFERTGINHIVRERRDAGAILIGTSAGSVQMGTVADFDPSLPLFSFLPYAIDAHAEPAWKKLSAFVSRCQGRHVGLGIPFGGGAIVHADNRLEPVLKPLTELRWTSDGVQKRELP